MKKKVKRVIKKIQKNKNLMLILSAGLLVSVIALIVITTSLFGKHKIKKIEDLYGTYAYIETIQNEDETELNIKVKIIFKDDKTAIFETSNGYSSELTKGTYNFKDKTVTYTKQIAYDPYKETEEPYADDHTRIVTFKVHKENKLKQVDEFYGQTIILERVD